MRQIDLKTFLRLRSLRVRLFIIILLIGIVPSVIMRTAIVGRYEQRAVESRVSLVQSQLLIVANHLVSTNYLTSAENQTSEAVIEAELEMVSNLYEGRVILIGSNFKVIKDTYDLSVGKTVISEEVIRCFLGETTYNYDAQNGYIELTTPIISVNSEDNSTTIIGVLLTSISTESIDTTIALLNRVAMLILALTILVILSLAILFSILLTRPFHRVTASIRNVQEGLSQEAIAVADYSETIHIIDAFNELLGRMRALDESRQEFVANVSHELKTPMTSLKVLADSLLMQPDAPAELYREFMEDMVSEIDRENRIITDLLSLVKLEKKVQKLNIAQIAVNDLVELILRRMRPIAMKRNVELIFESRRSVVAQIDEVKITQVLTNLVENAIKYNKEDGWVKVILDADHQYFTLEVSDSGLGIPPEALPHIYERFYRVDKSHSRDIGGTGLGLSITRSAVLMHRGIITVSSLVDQGSTFVVKIPLYYVEDRG